MRLKLLGLFRGERLTHLGHLGMGLLADLASAAWSLGVKAGRRGELGRGRSTGARVPVPPLRAAVVVVSVRRAVVCGMERREPLQRIHKIRASGFPNPPFLAAWRVSASAIPPQPLGTPAGLSGRPPGSAGRHRPPECRRAAAVGLYWSQPIRRQALGRDHDACRTLAPGLPGLLVSKKLWSRVIGDNPGRPFAAGRYSQSAENVPGPVRDGRGRVVA